MANKGRPGVMMYFDIRPGLEPLTAEEKGILFDAIMDYAELGTLPEFASPALRIAWGFIQSRIDSDAVRYENVRQRRRQAANKRWSGEDSTEDGMQMHANDANASTCMQMMPTTTTTTTPTTTTPTTTASTTTTTQSDPALPSGKESDFRPGPWVQKGYESIERMRVRMQEERSEE